MGNKEKIKSSKVKREKRKRNRKINRKIKKERKMACVIFGENFKQSFPKWTIIS